MRLFSYLGIESEQTAIVAMSDRCPIADVRTDILMYARQESSLRVLLFRPPHAPLEPGVGPRRTMPLRDFPSKKAITFGDRRFKVSGDRFPNGT